MEDGRDNWPSKRISRDLPPYSDEPQEPEEIIAENQNLKNQIYQTHLQEPSDFESATNISPELLHYRRDQVTKKN